MQQIIGVTGLIGAGKNTIARHLVANHGFHQVSWAAVLKDVTSILFGWDREMIDGATPESRAEREIPDPWWSEKMGKPWSPRAAMQQLGTDILRNHLHKDIWILSSMKRLQQYDKVVISDTRFMNEIVAIRGMGGKVSTVQRGAEPAWSSDLRMWKTKFLKTEDKDPADFEIDSFMRTKHPGIHSSEYGWHGATFDAVFYNNGTLAELYEAVDSVIGNQAATADWGNTDLGNTVSTVST